MVERLLPYLICPKTHEKLTLADGQLTTRSGKQSYRVQDGIPVFAESFCSLEGKAQQEHYDKIASIYVENLEYPHTQEYSSYLDRVFTEVFGNERLGVVAEICCGAGEAFPLLKRKIDIGIGLDVSLQMLILAKAKELGKDFYFVQGDAVNIPLEDCSFDTVVMLGGIHHVPNREALFSEVSRILKPGGQFVWREPVSDFWLWKILRSIIYRVSPVLDHQTERPLLYQETVPLLMKAGFRLEQWKTYGFLGFCLFMNSDVLFFNRFFRYVPGIRKLTRASVLFDDWVTGRRLFKTSGLQVVGKAIKS